MTLLRIKLHPSIKIKDKPTEFEGEFSGIKLIEAMNKLLSKYPQIHQLCLKDNHKKPGILYISDGAELASLGMLDTVIGDDEYIEVRIVPILHGG